MPMLSVLQMKYCTSIDCWACSTSHARASSASAPVSSTCTPVLAAWAAISASMKARVLSVEANPAGAQPAHRAIAIAMAHCRIIAFTCGSLGVCFLVSSISLAFSAAPAQHRHEQPAPCGQRSRNHRCTTPVTYDPLRFFGGSHAGFLPFSMAFTGSLIAPSTSSSAREGAAS
jgi:hypothetical protein